MLTLSKIIDIILRFALRDLPKVWADIFLIATTSGQNGYVSISQMANVYPGVPQLLDSSFDTLLASDKPKVLLVNFLDKGQVRVTNTVIAKA